MHALSNTSKELKQSTDVESKKPPQVSSEDISTDKMTRVRVIFKEKREKPVETDSTESETK